MKKLSIITPLLVLLFLFSSIIDVEAQRRRGTKKRPSKTEKPVLEENIVDRLWYGANINFGLSNNYFLFGLSPMVGYKFNNWLSAGPTLILNYSHQKLAGGGEIYNIKSFDYGAGLFTRAKFLNQFFVHAEYDFTNQEVPDILNNNFQPDPNDPNGILTKRESKNEMFIGIGYFSGGNSTIGYQATLLYDLLKDDTSQSLPISYRVGFTYNL